MDRKKTHVHPVGGIYAVRRQNKTQTRNSETSSYGFGVFFYLNGYIRKKSMVHWTISEVEKLVTKASTR